MAKVLVWKSSEGGKVRLHAIPDGLSQVEVGQIISSLLRRIGEPLYVYAIVDDTALPPGGAEFRGAWDIVNGQVTIPIQRARAIVSGKIRAWSNGEINTWRGRKIAAEIMLDQAGADAAQAAIEDWDRMVNNPALNTANVQELRALLREAESKRTGEVDDK